MNRTAQRTGWGNFNPRPREGGDLYQRGLSDYEIEISIHAPARGATLFVGWIGETTKDFNPRPRERGDGGVGRQVVVGVAISIHAPARGATNTGLLLRLFSQNFNPRPREGGDKAASMAN